MNFTSKLNKNKVFQSWEIISRLARCLMVGLPCGQFQGCSISPMWSTSFFISLMLRAVPTITCVNRKKNFHKLFILKLKKNTNMQWLNHRLWPSFTGIYLGSDRWVRTGLQNIPDRKKNLDALTDLRQALDANICLTREGRHMIPGLSLSMKMSSSMSLGPKVQFLLVGKDTNFTLSITWADKQTTIPHQL